MLIRPMELFDIDQVVELENATWTRLNTPAPLPVATKEKIISQFEGKTHFLVAEENSTILGVLDYQAAYPFEAGRHVVTFGIAVAPQSRSKGIGQELVASFIRTARLDGYRKILIHVLSTNPRASRFYEKLGFTLEAQLKHTFYIDDHYADDLIYSYDLEDTHAR